MPYLPPPPAKLAFEPTRNGRSLQTPISFWAFRAQPLLAAQLQLERQHEAIADTAAVLRDSRSHH